MEQMGSEVESIGDEVISPVLTVGDENRKQYYDLLMALYSTERKFWDSHRSKGIKQSAKEGNYKGRARIRIDKLAAQEIFLDYQNKKINSTEAARLLEISKSTFLRRYREYKNARQ